MIGIYATHNYHYKPLKLKHLMNCCSNEEMASEAMTSIFRNGLYTYYRAFIWLLSLGQVSSSTNSEESSVLKSNALISSDTVVSLLFIIHVVVVVAFIVSHCTVKKKKSQ